MSDSTKKIDLKKIAAEIERRCSSATKVFANGSNGYYDSNRHFLESSSQFSAYAVQPCNTEDLARIMKILAENKVAFGIKGGGHTTNPAFSSTTGFQIYMSFFDKIKYDSGEHFVDVGAGCLWDQVYSALANTGQNVVGGASSNGVGVAGYLLGGGYSLKSNQFGLGMDNILEMEVVIPNGAIMVVKEHPGDGSRLFKALKGGGNNFGIVTRFRLRTHPQGKTWGGTFSFEGLYEEKVKDAIEAFVLTEQRHEAAMVAAFRHSLENGEPKYNISVMCVYDGPKPDNDPWQSFATISEQAGTLKDDPANWKHENGVAYVVNKLVEMKCYTEVNAMASENLSMPGKDKAQNAGKPPQKSPWAALGTQDARGRFGCIMVHHYNRTLINAVASEAKKAAEGMKDHRGKLALFDVWPFLPSIFDDSKPAAWPHPHGHALGPLLAYFLWEGTENDEFWLGRMQTALDNLKRVAFQEGCATEKAPVYLNTSLETTKAEEIYRDELEGLRAIRKRYDPDNVMGRTGGFKIPLPTKPTEEWVESEDSEEEGEEDALLMLKHYHTVFIVDDSWSMRHQSRWRDAKRALEGIAEVAEKYDSGGIDIYFLNDERFGKGFKQPDQVTNLFTLVSPTGDTPTGARLEKLLLEYMNKIENARDSDKAGHPEALATIKPIDLIVITDGVPTDDPKSVIIAAAKRLDAGQWPVAQIGIQFVQVGTNRHAREHLQQLDDELSEKYKIRDMVDTTPYAGQAFDTDLLIKILLGGINRRFDEKVYKKRET